MPANATTHYFHITQYLGMVSFPSYHTFFQSASFFLKTVALLSTAPAFQQNSFWDIRVLSGSLSSRVALKFPVVPRSCWTPR